jgi:hypothetical protein
MLPLAVMLRAKAGMRSLDMATEGDLTCASRRSHLMRHRFPDCQAGGAISE